MIVRERAARDARAAPPRAVVWTLLFASAAAVLSVGLLTTTLILARVIEHPGPVPWTFWLAVAEATALTLLSLGIRSLRWVFLLRRADTRIPIRDAYIGYLAGLTLLFTPLLLGEIALRAGILRARGRVPVATTAAVNIWERLLDVVAVCFLSGITAVMLGRTTLWTVSLLAALPVMLVSPVRRIAIAAIRSVVKPVAARLDHAPTPQLDRLGTFGAVAVTLVAGVLAWVLPGVALWRLAHVWGHPFGLVNAEYVYALSATLTGLTLIPGGIVVAGREMLTGLAAYGLPYGSAVLIVLAVRFATAGISVALGAVMVWIHLRTRPTSLDHFDEIAEPYDAQIPETRQQDLLVRKTALMAEALRSRGGGARGLDVGCGQGKYVERMRATGFDVVGIDSSSGQVRRAARRLADPRLVTIGSVLEIPSPDASYDFVYTINVLHHLPSIVEQRRAFQELLRVLKPGGLLFVHEINTRNALFRFYMGYVFPSLNCIDEGVERWLLPDRLDTYVGTDLIDVKYFTFLPEVVPRPIVRWLTPLERLLEGSPLGVYSAHYMAIFRKKSAGSYGRG